jgi:pimeloyl-ACP methyl ester carboxylesterase
VYLRYNTGLHISQNGRSLAAQLAQLLGDRPHPVTELAVVAHSMGGLVMRSAIHCAQQEGAGWLKGLKHLVFLGTPHHGAPLERTGHWVELLLGKTPYSAPFAKLVQLRSAGITDLRYGFVADADWLGKDRFRRAPDTRQHVPLPEGVACHAFAATLAGQRSAVADRLVGDGLVPLPSALGQHDDPARSLVFDRSSQRIAYRTHHNALLTSPEVGQQLLEWLGPRAVAQQ